MPYLSWGSLTMRNFSHWLVSAWAACRSAPRSTALVWGIVCALLVPIWMFRYFPSQDGPAHLANSLVLRDCIAGEDYAKEYYSVAWQPIPNWTCFALLASLSSVAPPLIAEKLFLSLYVLAFAWAYRYFLGALGSADNLLILAGVLLAFNRCLWMGFYNYCLSLVLYFVVVGYLLRHWERFELRQVLAFSALVLLTYFTHLVGFILTAVSCLWFALTIAPRDWKKVVDLLFALAPSMLLMLWYFAHAQFSEEGVFQKLKTYLVGWVVGTDQLDRLKSNIQDYEGNLFGIHLDLPFTLGIGMLIFFLLLVVLSASRQKLWAWTRRRSVLVLGAGILILYFLMPDKLVFGKGGYFKARLAPLPPLLFLSCLELPRVRPQRTLILVLTCVMLASGLLWLYTFIRKGNEEVREFVSGIDSIGSNQMIVVVGAKLKPLWVNPLEHAEQYYCLKNHNVSFDDNFTTLSQSVVRLKPDFEVLRDDLERHPNQKMVDIYGTWNDEKNLPAPAGFSLVFQKGRLKLFRREGGNGLERAVK